MDDRSTSTTEKIAQTKEAVQRAKDELLKMFAAVPEDRLTWSPSPTARTAVWLVAHCGVANRAFAAGLRGEPLLLPQDPQEREAVMRAGGQDVTDRAEAMRSLEDSTAAILPALDAATDAKLAGTVETPFHPFPYSVWMQVPAHHMEYHRSQLAYRQTIWGDIQDH